MSWVKSLWNRMFAEDTEERETEVQWEEQPVQQPEKIPFRFPVITDKEREEFLRREAAAEDQIVPLYKENRKTETRKPDQNTDWERGPRLAPRPERRPEWQPEPRMAPRPERMPEPKKRSFEPVPVNKTRRFEPTRVPSPIHGFNEIKPAPIDQLLEQKELKAEEKKIEQAVTQTAPQEVEEMPVAPVPVSVKEEQQTGKSAEEPANAAELLPEKEEEPAEDVHIPVAETPEEIGRAHV